MNKINTSDKLLIIDIYANLNFLYFMIYFIM